MGAGRGRHRLCARRPARPTATTSGQHPLAPGGGRAPVGQRTHRAARGRWAQCRRARRTGGGRAECHRARRLGPVPQHRGGPSDEHLWPPRDHVRLAGGAGDRGAVAAQRERHVGDAGAPGRALGRAPRGDGLRGVLGLGSAGAAHGVDACHGDAVAGHGPALALAAGAVVRGLGGLGARSVGLAAARLLAVLRGGRVADGFGFRARR